MADYTQQEITDALAGVIDAVSDTGAILSDRRTAEEDAEALALLQSQNDGAAHGWLVTLMQISEADTPNGCEIAQTLTYSLEAIYPYERRRSDGTTSESGFRTMLGAVLAALRADRQLGLDGRVYHGLVKSEEDFQMMDWSSTGQDALITHFAKFRLEVVNSVFV